MALKPKGNAGTYERVYIVEYVEYTLEVTSHYLYDKSGYKLYTPEVKKWEKLQTT